MPEQVLKISKHLYEVIACPSCGCSLIKTENIFTCIGCQEEYAYSCEGQFDLRLRRKKFYRLQFELGNNILPEKGLIFRPLQKTIFPQVDYTDIKIPRMLTEELLSHFPKAKGSGSLMLDLGCGSTIHRMVCERAGFEYVGLDYCSPEATILGDAHALPFKDNRFEFILSLKVLEHIRYPLLMMREAYRVLKPGGKFIGSVAFLEPFHGESFYHYTHLGVFNSLQFAGFNIGHVAPRVAWPGLIAQAAMGLFPKSPRLISTSLVLPVYLLHRIWWKIGYLITHLASASEENRFLNHAGTFDFVASKGLAEE
jgi:SAM-dependent methyltransferase